MKTQKQRAHEALTNQTLVRDVQTQGGRDLACKVVLAELADEAGRGLKAAGQVESMLTEEHLHGGRD